MEKTKENIYTDLKSKLKEHQSNREQLRYERNQISFSLQNCKKLEYDFEYKVLLLKLTVIDEKIWMTDDFITYLNNLIDDLS